MCIIAYKPEGLNFPNKATLKSCFENNPDGGGYMFAAGGCVHIVKGLMSFSAFYKSLKATRAKYGDAIPYVLHFRISTQAGTTADCTHPFPVSANMDKLRKLQLACNIGIAHNGIIHLTSTGYSKSITYNDTMLFITDYLSLIIRGKDYYKDNNTLLLIERLTDSRLAILDGSGHCELIGKGWTEDGGIYYSNTSYKSYKPFKASKGGGSLFSLWDDSAYDDPYYDMY